MKKEIVTAGLLLCCFAPIKALAWPDKKPKSEAEVKREVLTQCLQNSGMSYVHIDPELSGEYPIVIEKAIEYETFRREYDMNFRRVTDIRSSNAGAYAKGDIRFDDVKEGPVRRKINAVEQCMMATGYGDLK